MIVGLIFQAVGILIPITGTPAATRGVSVVPQSLWPWPVV